MTPIRIAAATKTASHIQKRDPRLDQMALIASLALRLSSLGPSFIVVRL